MNKMKTSMNDFPLVYFEELRILRFKQKDDILESLKN